MKRYRLALAAACVSSVLCLEAEELRLKTRTIDPDQENESAVSLRGASSNPRSLSGKRWHWLIQIEEPEPDFTLWEQRGAKVLASVPVNGYLISAPEVMSWEGLVFSYRSPVMATDKISPQMQAASGEVAIAADTTETLVIVHFHKDVEVWEADGILEAEHAQPLWNGSLEAEDRLAELTAEQMAALALWDEVEYVFPAPAGMKEGEIYMGCGGVISGGYELAMLAASYGEGWDGPGRGTASISYSFGPLGTRTSMEETKAEVRRALAEWSKVVGVSFSESVVRNRTRNLDILFATGSHGDAYPFLSGSTVLGHSFYPANPNPEPIAGDIHINDAWTWSIGGQWDVFSVVLHEIGHSLGIGHTDVPGSVMYPYYQKATSLKQPDIDSIRQLYATATQAAPPVLSATIASPVEGAILSTNSFNLSGSITGGASGLQIQYTNEINLVTGQCLINGTFTTYSCPAIALVNGSNRIRIQSSLNSSSITTYRTVRREANGDVSLAITSPAVIGHTTTATEVMLIGTASYTGGLSSVKWTTNRSRSGSANGLENWNATAALEPGSNEITVTATARTGIYSTRTITIKRTAVSAPAPPANPGGDKVPPRMTIQQPIGNFIITSAPKLTFRGTAIDNIAVKQVTWTNSAGDQSGAATAAGTGATVSWSFDVNIAVGFNAIQVRAWDASGNSTLYSTTVRRY